MRKPKDYIYGYTGRDWDGKSVDVVIEEMEDSHLKNAYRYFFLKMLQEDDRIIRRNSRALVHSLKYEMDRRKLKL